MYPDIGIIIILIIFLILGLFAYIRLRYPFWSIQPVYHTYDIRWFGSTAPIVVLRAGDVVISKYTDKVHVLTKPFLDMDPEKIDEMVDLLQCHYIGSDRILNVIDRETMTHYLTGHTYPAYVSLYLEDRLELESKTNVLDNGSVTIDTDHVASMSSTCQIVNKPMVVGSMTSRPVRIFVGSEMTEETTYFWDFICDHRDFRARHISRYLIQTHLHKQQFTTSEIKTGLFRKEVILCEGVVPLVKYKMSTFLLQKIRPPKLPAHFTVVRVFNENLDILSDFLYGLTHPKQQSRTGSTTFFSFCAFPELGSLVNLVKQHILYVYALKRGEHIYGMYFFKDSKTIYDEMSVMLGGDEDGHGDGKQIECIASICNMDHNAPNLFFMGVLHALRDITKYSSDVKIKQGAGRNYRIITFSHLAHNHLLLEKWRWKYTPLFETPCAYYGYNMVLAGMPIDERQSFILL